VVTEHCLKVAAASEGIGRKDGHLRRGTPLAFLPRKACQTWKTCEVMFDIGFEPAFREVHIKTVESPKLRTRSEPVRTLSEPARNGPQLRKNCAGIKMRPRAPEVTLDMDSNYHLEKYTLKLLSREGFEPVPNPFEPFPNPPGMACSSGKTVRGEKREKLSMECLSNPIRTRTDRSIHKNCEETRTPGCRPVRPLKF